MTARSKDLMANICYIQTLLQMYLSMNSFCTSWVFWVIFALSAVKDCICSPRPHLINLLKQNKIKQLEVEILSTTSLVNQAVRRSNVLTFNIIFSFPSFLTFLLEENVKNDGKEKYDKGELIDQTAWFTRLTYAVCEKSTANRDRVTTF